MGTFDVEIEVGDPQGERWERATATVGTKATLAWAPRELLERLGVQPGKRIPLRHLDGRLIKRDTAETWLRVDGQSQMVTFVFGEKRDPTLIGSETLQQLGLAADLTRGSIVKAG
jgi:hypothetical protein